MGENEAFARAVADVWSAALTRKIDPDDDFTSASGDVRAAVRVVTLLNQWLGSALTVRDVFAARTPRAMVAALRASGVPTPQLDNHAVGGPPAGRSANRQVAAWQELWDATYRFSRQRADGFDTAGWFDSGSLAPMDDAAMREWVNATVDRIAILRPRSILDIGCGAGLLFAQLAPSVRTYRAMDFSDEAIRRVRSKARHMPGIDIEVIQGEARDVAQLVSGTYDLVVLNSVIQYFPDARYLSEVMRAVLARVAPGGAVFVGDVRNRDLLLAECTSIVTAGLPDNTPARWVRAAIDRAVGDVSELLMSPADLRAVMAAIDGRWAVRTLVRRGRLRTVMARYRFDALVHRSIDRGPRPESMMVSRSVPDDRCIDAVRLAEAIRAATDDPAIADPTLGRLRPDAAADAVDPEDLWQFGRAQGYGVAVQPSDRPGHVDVAVVAGHDDWSASECL
jgi:2-polyprenyl-3-methyl-5-hydroxy-6-metoxy-1,4-benzoquinol methylase